MPCLGHCDLAPVLLRGEALEPALTHSTNDGPSLGLSGGDEPAALEAPSAERIVAELHAAGLTGYGGAGFPAALKWEAVLREPGPRVLAVNADEGEPGTIKDRYVMELRPRLLVQAIGLVATAIDAAEVYVYLREEYGLARERLEAAIAEAGLRAELVIGAGAYIAGEETAMLESMEGRRAMPRLRPPFPAQRGHLARPTLDPQRRDARPPAGDPAARRRGVGRARPPRRERRPALVGQRRGRAAGLLRGAERDHAARAGRRARGRLRRRTGRDRPRRRGERDPAARRARRAADARRPR